MNLSFDHYWPLFLFLIFPVLWKIGSNTKIKIAPRHLKTLSIIRFSLISVLILVLMKPTWNRAGEWLSTVYAIDVSGSVEPSFIRSAIAWVSRVDAEWQPDHSAVVVFAGSAQTLDSPDQISSVQVSEDGSANSIDQSVTDLGIGLRQAINSFEPSHLKRLVLFTDGNGNMGEEWDIIEQAREEGVRIFTFPATVVGGNDSWVEAVIVPEEVRKDEPVLVDVIIFSRNKAEALVELLVGSEQNFQRPVVLEEGPNPVTFEVSIQELGLTSISARVVNQQDGAAENNRLDQSVMVQDQPKILYVEGRPESAHYLRDALEKGGMDVVLSSGADIPEGPVALDPFDLILLSDVPPEEMRQGQMEGILKYVRDFGGGLLFAAGESTYGKDGYSGSTIEELLPIWFEVEEERKELALVIVLDKSYSMVGAKLELSKEAAKAALGVMDPRHRFSVVTFDDTPYVAVPLQLASEAPRINQSISQIIAGSQTNIYPALEKAFEVLEDSEAEVKHIVLLSDGKTYADDYEELVTSMADEDITVSSVAVGEEADRSLLSNIAMWGNGRTYYIQDAQGVPQVFIKEAQIASQSTLIEERVIFESIQSSEIFTGLDIQAAPDLEGYVKTRTKENAEMLIEVTDGAPILARWHYGLGRTAAFTSDVKNRWSVNWLNWEGYGKFWNQLVRETMRRREESGLIFEVERVGEQAIVTVNDIRDEGVLRTGIKPEVTVSMPGEGEESLVLDQVDLGFYRAIYPIETSTDYSYAFQLSADEEEEEKNLHYTYEDEYRRYPVDVQSLIAMSDFTGGKFLPDEQDIFQDYGKKAYVKFPLREPLLLLALTLFLADLGLRRLPWAWVRLSKDERS